MVNKTVKNQFWVCCVGALSLSCFANEQSTIGLVDPTQPLQGVTSTDSDTKNAGWSLQGIFIGERGRLAIIDGQVVRAGDDVGGATIESIGDNRVILDNDNESVELRVRNGFLTPSSPEEKR